MADMNYISGNQIAAAIDNRILSIAKQVTTKSPTNRTAYGRVLKINNGNFSISINNTTYNNVVALKNAGYIKVGDRVICLIPNNQFNNMIILGVADGDILPFNNFSKEEILDFVYPVDSVYISTNDNNPNSLLGGVWESITVTAIPEVFFWKRVS